MIKSLISLIFFPIYLFSAPITTVYDCDDKRSFYIKVVGDFSSNQVKAYFASVTNSYKWELIADSKDISFFRDKLIMNEGNLILESPSEAWWGYKGDVVIADSNGKLDKIQACIVTFE